MITPLNVANTFIKIANERNTEMTHIKIQKLVYILFARYLQKTDDMIFTERFEVWQYGPVVPSLYIALKRFGAKHIKEPIMDLDGSVRGVTMDGCFASCFEEVWARYGQKDGVYLANITHNDNFAWRKAYKRDEKLGGVLNDNDIKLDGVGLFESA